MNHLQKYITAIQGILDKLPLDHIDDVIDTLNEARFAGKKIFTLGNGGSASTSSHFVCDLAKGTRKPGLPQFKVIGLADNMAIFSAYGNDEGYENVFAKQLASLVEPGDVVIGISASGNSPNVLNAVDVAHQMGAKTIGFTGFEGGLLGKKVDIEVRVESNCVEQIEDVHLMLEHLICKTIRDETVQLPVEHLLSQAMGKDLVGQLDARASFRRILQLTLGQSGASSGSLLLVNDKGDVIEGIMAYDGKLEAQKIPEASEVLERGLAGWVFENQKPALVSSTREDPRWLQRSWETDDTRSRSAISVPLVNEQRVIGVLTLVHPQADHFSTQDMGDVQQLLDVEISQLFISTYSSM